MKIPDIGRQILVQPNDTMLPTQWTGYDADDQVVETGALGVRIHRFSEQPVTRLVCGRRFYDDLRQFIANQTRYGT